MSCYTSPITGQPSVLAQLLDTNYGPMVRDRIMSYVYSDEFLSKYGDFKSPITKIPLDSIGKEPSFEWVQSKLINKEQFSKNVEELESIIASEKTIRDLSARLSERIGMPIKFESDRTADYKGKIQNNVAVINLAHATLDTPIHEILGHPIIRAIKDRGRLYTDVKVIKTSNGEYHVRGTNLVGTEGLILSKNFSTEKEAKEVADNINNSVNPNLYQNLLKELEYGRGKEVLDKVKRDYKYKTTYKEENATSFEEEKNILSRGFTKERIDEDGEPVYRKYDEYTLEEQQEEALVTLLGLMTANKLDAVKDGKLISLLKRLLKEMKSFVRELLSQSEVEIDKLPDNMTIGDIADLLAYSNNKLILPGYEVTYTTPDNQKFKTYAEASNHISELAKSVEEVELDNVNIQQFQKIIDPINNKEIKRVYSEWVSEPGLNNQLFTIEYVDGSRENRIDDSLTREQYNFYKDIEYGKGDLNNFINKNKEYEQSREIIEEWKKVNNIQYNPEEIYSRGQEFTSVLGAYSSFDVNLMMQNLLQHIEDNEKAGGKFAVSAFTKPVDKIIGHLEGGGGKIKFKIYPKSEDILWAANTDVYSGSVWDASEKVNKDKKSELLGVSYTKYPSLRNTEAVQPNLASIVENLAHHHNELGITLTGNNFRLEYDDNIPYGTKKIINSINSILDQKYGKVEKPKISKIDTIPNMFEYWQQDMNEEGGIDRFRIQIYKKSDKWFEEFFDSYGQSESVREITYKEVENQFNEALISNSTLTKNKGIQPTQTNATLKESINSIKSKVTNEWDGDWENQYLDTLEVSNYLDSFDGVDIEGFVINNYGPSTILDELLSKEPMFDTAEEANNRIKELIKEAKKIYNERKSPQKEYTSQALVNTKIAKLKEAAKKYPRSLIRSEVTPSYNGQLFGQPFSQWGEDELPFSKLGEPSEDEIEELYQALENKLDLRDYPIASIIKKDFFNDEVSLLENTKYWVSELEQFSSLKESITKAIQEGDNDTALKLKKSLDSLVDSEDFEHITQLSRKELDQSEFRLASDYMQEIVDRTLADLTELQETLKDERQELIESLEVISEEPNVYQEFGTSYKFNVSPSGVISGEYRQGAGEWKPLNAKTAQDKYERFVSPPQAPQAPQAPPPPQSTTPTVSEGIEINSKQTGLGNDLTNVHYATDGKSKFDIKPSDTSLTLTTDAKNIWGESVEAWYKSNNAKSKGIPKGTEGDAYDMKLMIGLITDKLKQYPNLVSEITNRGGMQFLDKSTHNMGTGRWSSKNPKNMFMNALKEAYQNVTSSTPTVTTKILKNEDGLIIAENVIPKADTVKMVEQAKKLIEETSFKQTAGAVSWGYGMQWMRINAMTAKQREGLVIGEQLNGRTITQAMKDNFIKTGDAKGFPLYGYTTIDKNGKELPSIPQDIINYLASIGIDISQYDASYNSVYDKADDGSLIIHQDNTENNKSPIITISLGRPMKFVTYELKDSSDFNVADSNNTAFRIAVNAVQGEALKLNLIPRSAKDSKGGVKYGHFTPDTLLKYAEEIDKKQGTNLKQFVIDKLKEQFKNAEKTEYTLNNGSVLVFSGNNRNVLHEIVFDPETNAKPMEPGFPTLKVNKAFKGLGHKDNFVSTSDYRVVLTLRKVQGETLTNVVNQGNFIQAASSQPSLAESGTSLGTSTSATVLVLPDNIVVTKRSEVTQANIDEMKTVLKEQFVNKAFLEPTQQFKAPWQNPASNKKADNYGFTEADYARMMDEIRMEMGDKFPSNLVFFQAFEFAMNNNPERLIKAYSDRISSFIAGRSPYRINDLEMAKMTSRMEVAITSLDGMVVDYFTKKHGSGSQEAVSSMMLTAFVDLYNKAEGRVTAPHLISQILLMAKHYSTIEGPNQELWKDIVSSFTFKSNDPKLSFLDALFEDLMGLGYRIDYNSKNALKDYFFEKKNDPSFMQNDFAPSVNIENSKDWERDYSNYLDDSIDRIEVEDMKAKVLRDWQDSAFERSSKDQATARLKLFMGNQKAMEPFNVVAVKYDPNDKTAIDLTDMIKLPEDLTLAQARQLNGKIVMHKNFGADSLQGSISKKFPRIPKKGLFGFPVITSFDSLYENAQGVLSSVPGLEKDINKALDLLRAENDPNLSELADRLQALEKDKRLQKEFIKVMNMQYNEFFVVKAERKKGKNKEYVESRVFGAQRYSQDQVIVDRWKQAQAISSIIKVRPNGERVIDVERSRVHVEVIKLLSQLSRVSEMNDEEAMIHSAKMNLELTRMSPEAQEIFKGINFIQLVNEERLGGRIPRNQQRLQQKAIIKRLFAEHNIDLSDNVLEDMAGYYLDKSGKKVDVISSSLKNTKMKASWISQYSQTEMGKPSGIFSAFFYAAAGLTEGGSVDTEVTEELENSVLENNPLYTESTSTKVLAKFVRKHSDKLYNGVHTNLEGKQIWDYSLHSSLSRAVQDLTSNHNGYADKVIASVWGSNYYLNKLGNLKLGYLEGLKVDKEESGTVRQRMSDREQLLSSILLYQNQGRKSAYMISLTHSDKTTTPVFSGIPKVKVVGDDGNTSQEIVDAFFTVFSGEWNRIVNVKNQIDTKGTTGTKAMDTSGLKFLLFPNLNFESLTDEEKLKLYDEDGNVKQLLQETEITFVKDKIRQYLGELFDDAKSYWLSNGITNSLLDSTYTYNESKGLEGSAEDKANMLFDTAVADYVFNSTLWNMTVATVLMGDPANIEWKGNVEKTMAEYAKRLAKDIAPRQQLSFDSQYYSQLTVADVTMKYEYAKKFGSNVHKSKATDAQEFTTVREHLIVMKDSGKISDSMYNTLIAKVNKFDTKDEEEFTPEELDTMLNDGGTPFQPTKPIYAGARFKNGLIYYDYLKSSSVPLLPQFTENSELDKVRKLMEGKLKGADRFSRLVFESGSKTGNSNNPLTLFTTEGNFIEPSQDVLDSNTRLMDRAHFGIQQEVPFEEDKEEVNVITQMDKLIVEGILGMTDFKVGGVEGLTGVQVRAMKEDVRIKAARIKLNKLYKSLGMTDNTKSIPANEVIKLLIETARQSEFSPNDIAILESTLEESLKEKDPNSATPTYPLFFHPAVKKFEKLLLAKVKSVTEFKMPGRSYVQVSSIGLIRQDKLSEKAKLGIITVGDFDMSKPLRHMQIDEVTGEVIPAQVIMPFNFIVDGKRVNIQDYLVDGKLDTERVPRELLQLVAARIPNQGHNSMMAIEIVGFTPDWMGDAMIVPSAITGQMGSDFDVDKLFTYQRPYMYNEVEGKFETYKEGQVRIGESPEEYQEFENIAISRLEALGYKKNDEGNFSRKDIRRHIELAARQRYQDNIPSHLARKEDKTLEELQQDYFNIHWGVLTHPGLYTKVLEALDKEDLGFEKGAANDLFKRDTQGTNKFFSPISQLKSFQAGKDAKDLVGMTSLSSTFDSNLQNKKLRLGTYIKVGDSITEMEDSIVLDGIELTTISGESLSQGYDTLINEDGTLDEKTMYSKHANITIDQTGAVDNAKDRRLDNLNITMATYPAFDAMNKLHGETKDGNRSVSKLFQCALSAQEILWEYTDEYRKGNDSLSDEYSGDLRQAVVRKLKDKYSEMFKNLTGQDVKDTDIDSIQLTMKNLTKAFKSSQKGEITPEYCLTQLKVLDSFNYLCSIGERLRELQKTLNQDTNGAGRSLVYVLQQLENYNNIFSKSNKVFLNEDSIVSGQMKELFEMTVPVAKELLSSVLPVDAIESVIRQVAAYEGKSMSQLSLKTQESVVDAMRAYTISSSPAIAMDTTAERVRLLYSTESGPSLAKRVERAKQLLPDNAFLKRLDTTISAVGVGPDFVSTLVQNSTRMTDNAIIQDFARLIQSSDDFVRELGEDLVSYGMILTPLANSNSITGRIPAGVILGTDISSQLRFNYDSLRINKTMPKGFIDQLYQHISSLGLSISSEMMKKGSKQYSVEGREYSEILTFTFKDLEKSNLLSFNPKTLQNEPPPYLKFYSKQEGKMIRYKLLNEGNVITYLRIDTAGNKKNVEYNSEIEGPISSIFGNNKAAFAFSQEDVIRNLENSVEKEINQTSDPNNAFSRWSLTDGGEETLTMALEQLSADSSVPTYLRTISEALADSSVSNADIEARLAIDYKVQPLRVEFRDTTSGALGSYKAATNVLSVRKQSNVKKAAVTLIHETIHQRSSSILHAMGWVSKERLRLQNPMSDEKFEELWSSYLQKTQDFIKNNPEMYAKAMELDKLRLQALEQLKSELRAAGIDVDAKMEQVYKNKLDGSDEDFILYSLSSLPEFVAHVLTDTTVMKYLNTVESVDSRSWIAKMVDSFLDFVQQVLDTLGVAYNDKSILKDCLALSYDLTNLNTTSELKGSDTSLATQAILVDTESKANHIHHTVENIYNQKVTRNDTHFGHELLIEEGMANPKPFTAGTDFFNNTINRLGRQLQQLDNTLARPVHNEEDRKRRTQGQLIYNEAKDDYDKLIANKNDEIMLMDVAKKQLEWVSQILTAPNKPYIHLQEITIAWSILDTWNTLSSVYKYNNIPDGDVKDNIDQVQSLSTILSQKMLTQSMKSVVTEGTRVTGFNLSLDDLGVNLKDLSTWEKNTIAFERDMNKASQMLTTYAQYQVQNAQAALRRVNQKLIEFKKLVKPSEYGLFIQENQEGSVFGLVQELHPDWYKNAANERYTLKSWLENLIGLDIKDPQQRARRVDGAKAAYTNFWKKMSAVGEAVRIDRLLDLTTGELRTDPEAQAEIARLKSISREHLVDDVIAQAQADYKKYLALREAKFENIDFNGVTESFRLNPGEDVLYASMTVAEQEQFRLKRILELTTARKEQQKREWEFFNSPLNFFETIPQPGVQVDENIFLQNGRFKPWFVPKNIEGNFDKKFEYINKNQDLRKGYEILKNLSGELRAYLPPTIAENLHDNFLPIISPELMAEGTSLLNKVRKTGVGRSMLNSISVSREETMRRDVDGIPISYVGDAPRVVDARGKRTKKIDMSKVSTDLPRMFEMFADMAIHYNTMYPVNELIDVTRRLVTEESNNRVNAGKVGLPNLVNLMKSYQETVIFRKGKQLEGVDTTPLYSLNTSVHKAKKKEMAELIQKLSKVNQRILVERVDESSDPNNPLFLERKELEERIKEIQSQARYVAASKIGDSFIGIQQLKSMAYNPFSAVSNLTFGYISTFIHARGFRAGKDGFTTGDFTRQQLQLAYSMMRGNVLNSWLKAFGYSHSDLSRKITAIITRANAIEALIDTRFGSSNIVDDTSNLQKFFDPTAAQKSGDWLTKGAVIIARALNTPVQVTVNGETKTINLFEALNTDGEWDDKKYGENKEWSSENAADQVAWNKFLFRTRKVMLLIFGNQDKNIPLDARRSIFLQLIGQFRLSWIPEGIKTRWGSNQGYDETLERELEGRYRTMLRMDGFGIPLMLKQMMSVVTGQDAFEGVKVTYNENGQEMTRDIKDFEIENMRRNMAGMAYTLLFASMYYMLKGLVPDEEELRKLRRKGIQPSTAAKIASNVAYRSFQDLVLYTSPGIAEQITGNLIPSWSVVSDVMKATKAWWNIAFDDKYEWEDFMLKQTKALPYLNLLNKWEFYSKHDISAAVR